MTEMVIVWRRIAWATLFVSALLHADLSYAHHSFAAHYDVEREIELKGVVTDYRFINPHVLVFLDVAGQEGGLEEWVAETNSPTLFRRMNMGLQSDSIVSGDIITVTGYPSRFNHNDIHLTGIRFADGREMAFRNVQAEGR